MEKLAKECLEGNTEAWRLLVDTFSKKIFNLAYQFCGRYEEAEDLTQEIFMKIFTSLPKYDGRKNFTAWILVVAKNHLIDSYRQTKRKIRPRDNFDVHLPANLTPDPEVEMIAEQERQLIWKGIGKLSPDLRLAIILKEIQGKSYEEVAEILNIPVGTVKSRINRGKLQLAQILTQEVNQT
ncbi:MAG: RNA polymerase sigma factor [Candidatus Aminicenantes bacterium]|nr:RNA polymerase sigma factor [Candidatus Aminicenantes bacterium]